MTIRDECAAALQHPNVQAFLRVIREGESSQDGAAYRMQVGGRLLESLDFHPREVVTVTIRGREIKSSAAGAYQFLTRTWDGCAKALGLTDFSAESQDLAAVYLIRGRGALADVISGRVVEAIRKCAAEWASLPGDVYGQGGQSLERALAVWRQWGGSNTPQPAPDTPQPAEHTPQAPRIEWPFERPEPEKRTMPLPAIVAAVLPSIIEAIPRLGKLFGSGSEVAERNVKAAELAVEIVKDAAGAVNAQDAAEKVKADPVIAATAARAIEARWLELDEAGGGGIAGARKADAEVVAMDGPWWQFLRSPSFWALLLLVPLVYLLVGSLIGLWGTASWSDDVRAGLAGSIISAVIGGAVGYYWGQTTSRNRTPQ